MNWVQIIREYLKWSEGTGLDESVKEDIKDLDTLNPKIRYGWISLPFSPEFEGFVNIQIPITKKGKREWKRGIWVSRVYKWSWSPSGYYKFVVYLLDW